MKSPEAATEKRVKETEIRDKNDMAAGSLIDVVQQAVDLTGTTDVPVEDRTLLLSDNGPGYLSRQFNEYLKLVGTRHIIASPYHPETNGKIEVELARPLNEEFLDELQAEGYPAREAMEELLRLVEVYAEKYPREK